MGISMNFQLCLHGNIAMYETLSFHMQACMNVIWFYAKLTWKECIFMDKNSSSNDISNNNISWCNNDISYMAYYSWWKISLFHILTFIPKKLSRLPAFMSSHSMHMQNLLNNFCGCKVIHKNMKLFHRQ